MQHFDMDCLQSAMDLGAKQYYNMYTKKVN